jgi:hypothetical protein
MADHDRPNQNANKEKAEGGRPDTEQHRGRDAARGVKLGGPERPTQREADDVLNRSAGERYDTPRRYEDEDSSHG